MPESPAGPSPEELAAAHAYQSTMLDALARWYGSALRKAAQEAAESALQYQDTIGRQAGEIARLRQMVDGAGVKDPPGIPGQPADPP